MKSLFCWIRKHVSKLSNTLQSHFDSFHKPNFERQQPMMARKGSVSTPGLECDAVWYYHAIYFSMKTTLGTSIGFQMRKTQNDDRWYPTRWIPLFALSKVSSSGDATFRSRNTNEEENIDAILVNNRRKRAN